MSDQWVGWKFVKGAEAGPWGTGSLEAWSLKVPVGTPVQVTWMEHPNMS